MPTLLGAIDGKNPSNTRKVGIFWLYRSVKADNKHLMVAIKSWVDVERFILPTDRRTEQITSFDLVIIKGEDNAHPYLSSLNQENQRV